jgi:hypothetical protein
VCTIALGLSLACLSPRPVSLRPVNEVVLRVMPSVVLAGKPVTLTWFVPETLKAREWCVDFDRTDEGWEWRVSCQTITPQGPHGWQRRMERPPEGRYTVRLVVRLAQGTRTVQTTLCVVGPDTVCGPRATDEAWSAGLLAQPGGVL